MSVFLAAPDLRRLLDFFVLNRPTAPADLTAPRFERRWFRIGAMAFQIMFVGYYLFTQISGGWRVYKSTYIHPPRPPLYGLYEVETFIRNGRELPPLITDATRWRKVIVQFQAGLSVKMMDDSVQSFGTEYDAAKNAVILTVGGDKNRKYPLSYSRPDSDHLLLEGTLVKDPVSVRLRKIDASKFLLLSRGFHWINEVPFNR
jgi:hypothetical protein